jgi:hypothetical protein
VTALITGVHIPETSFSQLLAEIKEKRRAAPASWNIARRNSSCFHIYRRKRDREGTQTFLYCYLDILISPWYQISSNLLPRPLPMKFLCDNIIGSSH